MAKNHIGKVLAFVAGAGAAAAGIAYFARYKSFHKALERDFHDFEDEDFEDGNPEETDKEFYDKEQDAAADLNNPSQRNYVSLSSSKDEFRAAAKDVRESVEDAASAAKDVLKDTAAILKDTAHDAVSAAVDTAHIASAAVKDTIDSYRDKYSETDIYSDANAASQLTEAADAFTEQLDKSCPKQAEGCESAADKPDFQETEASGFNEGVKVEEITD